MYNLSAPYPNPNDELNKNIQIDRGVNIIKNNPAPYPNPDEELNKKQNEDVFIKQNKNFYSGENNKTILVVLAILGFYFLTK